MPFIISLIETEVIMNGIFIAEKNISKLPEHKSVMIKISSKEGNKIKELSCTFCEEYEEDGGKVILDEPIKVLEKILIDGSIASKSLVKSYYLSEVTNDLVKKLSSIIDMFDSSPVEVKRVFL